MMLTAPPLPTAHRRAISLPETALLPEDRRATRDNIWDLAESCLTQTAAALRETRAVSATELSQGIALARDSHAMGKPADLLEVIAKIQGHAGARLGVAILDLGNKVAATLSPYQHVIPFGGRLIAPSAFYDSYDHLHKIAKVLLSPVIYAEDNDAIGTASINPMASRILADEICSTVFERFGITPFVTVARLDYDSWISLSHKHFEL